VVALIWLGVQVARIQREETLLRSDGYYQDYVRQVRWRLVPRVW
jgi:protein-S-isoprenylcysteine O-methyltransferase Ste14